MPRWLRRTNELKALASRNQTEVNRNHKQSTYMPEKVKPLGGRVLVEPLEPKEVVKGGIVIPDTAREKPSEGRVIALGTGKIDDKGNKVPFEVKKGDRVLLSKYGGTEIEVDDKKYKILESDEILAIVE